MEPKETSRRSSRTKASIAKDINLMKKLIVRNKQSIVGRYLNDWTILPAKLSKNGKNITETDIFQVGHLNTLRYISIPHDELIPTQEWINGFIAAARDINNKSYGKYTFYSGNED